MKFAGLGEGVSAGGGIADEQNLVRGGLIATAEDAVNLFQLLHEVVLRVEAASGVADEEIGLFAHRLLITIEANRGRIAIRRPFDERDAQTLAPDSELLDGGGAESVRSGQNDLVAAVVQNVRQFRGGGGFARSVHADDEEHFGLSFERRDLRDGFWQNLAHMLARDLHDVRAMELPLLRFEVIHDLHGQFRPEIAADERGLQFVPVDVGLGEALEE